VFLAALSGLLVPVGGRNDEELVTRRSLEPRLSSRDVIIIMAALCNRAGRYIFALRFLSIFYLSVFPRLISAAAGWMSTIL